MSDYFDTSSDSDDGSVENFGIPSQPSLFPSRSSKPFASATTHTSTRRSSRPGVTAHSPWRSLRAVFRDNRDTRATFLRDEFHGFNQGDLSVVDYTSKMKHMADTLGDLGSHVKDRELVHNVLRGLDQRLQHAVPHMTRGRFPTFIKLRSFLLLEEQRLGRQARVDVYGCFYSCRQCWASKSRGL
ncbi:hypothetical protein QYE76_013113 [Lolium multiflorum]|uniref:Retrotransposon gag domain-containing protein n=1 Tax=Lolium multiflorum TaxID=4521 RepID=A0AAD8U037_LOLMU|nr:hypothetical protein QYE76_013113 [Lolium multiflorum]